MGVRTGLLSPTASASSPRFLGVVQVGQGDMPDGLIVVENFLSEVRARMKR
jgi:hypothetical protein